MSAIGDLVVNLVARTKQFTGPLSSALSSVQSFVRSVTPLSAIIGTATAGLSIGAATAWGFQLANQAEQARIAFKTMLGSAEQAKSVLADLSRFAESTPYTSPEVVAASKQLLAFGIGAHELIPTLRMLGDVGAGVGSSLGDMAYLFGTAHTQGRLFSQDINQFTGRGVPIIKALAETMGVAENQVKKLVEAGQVGFPELQAAFAHMTREGGQFGGMMDAQSRSVNGLLSTMQDKVGGVAKLITESLMEAFDVRGILQTSIDAVGQFSEFLNQHGSALKSIAETVRYVAVSIGIMTAAAIAYTVAQRAMAVGAIVLQAIINPANLLKVGASLALAAGVIATLDYGLREAGASAGQVTEKVEELGAAAREAKGIFADLGTGLNANGPAQSVAEQLRAWRAANPEGKGLLSPVLKTVTAADKIFPDADQVSERVRGLHQDLLELRETAQFVGSARAAISGMAGAVKSVQDQIGEATGISAAIRDAQLELETMSAPNPQIAKTLARFQGFGALPGQIRELDQWLQKIETAKAATEAFQEQQRRYDRGRDFITDLQDRLDVLKGVASETDIELRRLGREGISPEQLALIEKLLKEEERLKALRENSNPYDSTPKTDFAAALSRNSAGAINAIQRVQFSGDSPLSKLNNTAKEQLKATKESNRTLKELVSSLGYRTNDEGDIVADFG